MTLVRSRDKVLIVLYVPHTIFAKKERKAILIKKMQTTANRFLSNFPNFQRSFRTFVANLAEHKINETI